MSNRNSFLPSNPTHGQKFVDSEFVQWSYDAYNDVWEKTGVVDSIPIATAQINGLMRPQDKALLDSVPAVPGGFGIIVDTKLLLQNQTNPEGVVTGDIKLRSESLNITCVGPNRVKLECEIPPTLRCEGADTTSSALSFSLSEKFLKTLYVDLSGPKGKQGKQGKQGKKGEPGYSLGPVGDRGKKGEDIGELCSFSGVSYRDIAGLSDNAIVSLKIADNDGHGCKLVVTKAKLNLDSNRAADKVNATGISRSLVFTDADDSCGVARLNSWSLVKPPGDTTPTNIQLLRLSKGSNEREGEPINFNGTMSLEALVTDLIEEYQNRLRKIDETWGRQAKQHIESIDNKARNILSNLANDLAMCEFALPASEYCITFVGCPNTLPPDPPPPPVSPLAVAALRAGSTPFTTGGRSSGVVGMGTKKWSVNS